MKCALPGPQLLRKLHAVVYMYLLFNCSGLSGRAAMSSASAGVRSGHGQAAAPWSVRRRVSAAVRLPVQLRDGIDRMWQH